MTLLKDVEGITALPEIELIKSTRLWTREVEEIDTTTLTAVHKKIAIQSSLAIADELFLSISNLLLSRWISGGVENNDFAVWSPPPYPRLSSDLLSFLERFTPTEASALTFGLLEEVTLDKVVSFTWADANGKSWQPETASLLNGVTRHLHSKYVFWEFDSIGRPTPLLGLPRKFIEISKVDWIQFRKNCKNVFDDAAQSKPV